MLWIDTYHIIRAKILEHLHLCSVGMWPSKMTLDEEMMYKKSLYSQPQVNQHPPAHHEGWMVSGQATVFCWVTVPS
jgi:hypothetical protein